MKALGKTTSVAGSPIFKCRENAEIVAASLPEPQSRTALFREMCLRRDDHCCVITQQIDINHWLSLKQPPDVMYGDGEDAHIIYIPFVYAGWQNDSAHLFIETPHFFEATC